VVPIRSIVCVPLSISQSLRRNAIQAAALLLALLALPAAAQSLTLDLPRVSPHATVSQRLGLTEVTVDYHRPSVNGRELWGGLVPYGEVWRAGANENTTVTFSHPVAIEGHELAAGTYGLHMIPGPDEWVVAFSNENRAWGSFSYDAAEDALRVTVKPQTATAFTEQLRYDFDDVSDDGATLALAWGDLRLPLALTTDTRSIVLASVAEDLRGLAKFDARSWREAATFAFQRQLDDEQALAWIDQSIRMEPNVVSLNLKARLLDRLGRGDEVPAVLAAAEGLAASERDINVLGYTFLQSGDVERAVAAFERNVQQHPESWNAHDSLAEGLAAAGRTGEAIEQYSKALEMAPEGQHGRIEAALETLRGNGGGAGP